MILRKPYQLATTMAREGPVRFLACLVTVVLAAALPEPAARTRLWFGGAWDGTRRHPRRRDRRALGDEDGVVVLAKY
jgi:hypothetical protein